MISPALVLTASLIGSPHCAAMCGGFAAMSCNSATPRTGQLLYNFGRMVAYVFLGALAGFIGGRANLGGHNFGVHHLASLFSGALLILWGAGMLLGNFRRGLAPDLSSRLSSFVVKTLRIGTDSLFAPFLLGISSAFLPCGWLYTYVAVAGGTGSASTGMAVMTFFWLGTLPMLLTIGGLSRIVSSPLKKFAPTLTSLLIIAAGFFSLFDHISLIQGTTSETSCHDSPVTAHSH